MRRITLALVPAALLVCVAVAGCSPNDDTPVVTNGSSESELQLQSIELLGTIAHNETKAGGYSGGAEHRGFVFEALGGDHLTVGLTLEGGRALGWITDANNNVLASSTDAQEDAAESLPFDAVVRFRVPPGPRRPLRFAFKDRSSGDARFRVKLSTCSVAGELFRDYLAQINDCATVQFDCPGGTTPFINLCGCGCERPH